MMNTVRWAFLWVHATLSLQFNRSALRRTDEKNLIVMVRVFNPMPGMIERLGQFAEDLKENSPDAQLVVAIDKTRDYSPRDGPIVYEQFLLPPAELVSGMVQAASGPTALIHEYTWSEVEGTYPVVLSLGDASAYNLHTEAIIETVQYTRKKIPVADTAHVWVLEDDVFICGGGISEFINSYRNDTSDLLAGHYFRKIEDPVMSSEFLRRFRDGTRVQAFEHVERFSLRFLAHLYRESAVDHVTAMSEIFAPTECFNNPTKFTCGEFRPKHIGMYKTSPGYDRREAMEVCGSKSETGVTVNHPGKFFSVSRGDM